MSDQLEMFPDMPYKAPDDFLPSAERELAYYYVVDAKRTVMLSIDRFTGERVCIDLDLSNPRILLYNSRGVAKIEARNRGLKVEKYPYSLGHLFSR